MGFRNVWFLVRRPAVERWDVIALKRAVYAWAALLVSLFLFWVVMGGGGPGVFLIVGLFLAAAGVVFATSAVIEGHQARLGALATPGSADVWKRATLAIILGYLWWFTVSLITARDASRPLLFFVFLGLIELPRLAVEKANTSIRVPFVSILLLGAVTWAANMGWIVRNPVPGSIGALELVILAAWWPFSRRTGWSSRGRILVGGLLYIVAALAVVTAWLRLRSLG